MSDEDYCISQEGQHSADYTSSTNNVSRESNFFRVRVISIGNSILYRTCF